MALNKLTGFHVFSALKIFLRVIPSLHTPHRRIPYATRRTYDPPGGVFLLCVVWRLHQSKKQTTPAAILSPALFFCEQSDSNQVIDGSSKSSSFSQCILGVHIIRCSRLGKPLYRKLIVHFCPLACGIHFSDSVPEIWEPLFFCGTGCGLEHSQCFFIPFLRFLYICILALSVLIHLRQIIHRQRIA